MTRPFKAFKAGRSQAAVDKAQAALAAVANSETENLFAAIVEAAEAGVTHGEIIALLSRELGPAQPLVVA